MVTRTGSTVYRLLTYRYQLVLMYQPQCLQGYGSTCYRMIHLEVVLLQNMNHHDDPIPHFLQEMEAKETELGKDQLGVPGRERRGRGRVGAHVSATVSTGVSIHYIPAMGRPIYGYRRSATAKHYSS